jgi:hypothetical protein
MPATAISMLRALALDVGAMGVALAAGLLGMAYLFHTDIPGHCSATVCVEASIAIGYIGLAALAVFFIVPAPSERRAPLPSATIVER